MIRGYLRGVHPHDMSCPAETVLRDHDFHIYEIGVSLGILILQRSQSEWNVHLYWTFNRARHLFNPSLVHKITTVQNPSHKSSFPVLERLTRSGPRFTHFCPSLQRHNAPANSARELFTSSTDSASLLVSIKKKYFIWVRCFLWGTSQSGGVFWILTEFDWPWTPIQWAKILTQTFSRNYMIIRVYREPLIDLLECLEPKLWPKNSVVHKYSITVWVSHRRLVRHSITHDISPREYAKELFAPSKDTRSVVVWTEKKLFETGVWEFWWVSSERG